MPIFMNLVLAFCFLRYAHVHEKDTAQSIVTNAIFPEPAYSLISCRMELPHKNAPGKGQVRPIRKWSVDGFDQESGRMEAGPLIH